MNNRNDMQKQSRGRVNYINSLAGIEGLSDVQKAELLAVTSRFSFKTNDYYLSLIDWDDPKDPIRRLIIPDVQELDEWGDLDPSNEEAYTIMPGVEHKYSSTMLLLVSNVCDSICRYCFRKRVFLDSADEVLEDIDGMIEYLKSHKEITNVLLTGGDPLMIPTEKLERIVAAVRQVEHVSIIRIGTKIPVFNPLKLINDDALFEMIGRYSLPDKKIYVMTHFSHPRELTDVAARALTKLQKAGAMVTNQCPLIRGINDDPDVLAALFSKASFAGAIPYYLFQCRPALGNSAYTVPIEEGYDIAERAKTRVSGLAKRFRFVMSHETGKIEIVGKDSKYVYMKYHRAQNDADSGRFMVFKSNPSACWLDDYDKPVENLPLK